MTTRIDFPAPLRSMGSEMGAIPIETPNPRPEFRALAAKRQAGTHRGDPAPHAVATRRPFSSTIRIQSSLKNSRRCGGKSSIARSGVRQAYALWVVAQGK
jgi:hypothetical protein